MLPKTLICDADIGRFLLFRTTETITASLLSHGDFEPLPRQLVAALFPDGDAVVVDAGANIGTFTIPVAQQNPTGLVYAFEPQRIIFYQLCANLILNSLSNVKAIHAALGQPDSIRATIDVPVVDYSRAKNLGAISLINRVQYEMIEKGKYTIETIEKVEFTSLDMALTSRDRPIDFMKIDVEGMELHVLSGAAQLITQDRPVVFFESWRHARDERRDLAGFFEAREYSLYYFGNDALAMPRSKLRSGKSVTATGNNISIT